MTDGHNKTRSGALNGHILNTSGTMVGVCVTVISLVKILERQRGMSSSLDEAMSINAIFFVVAAFFSYLSIRAENSERDVKIRKALRLERAADLTFVVGLLMMGACSVLFAFEFI